MEQDFIGWCTVCGGTLLESSLFRKIHCDTCLYESNSDTGEVINDGKESNEGSSAD